MKNRLNMLLALTLCIVCLTFQVLTQSNVDEAIEDVFGKPEDNDNDPSVRGPTTDGTKDLNLEPGQGGSDDGGESPDCCVPYYLCNNGSINKNGVEIIDIRINEDEPPKCKSNVEICCVKEFQVREPITPASLPEERTSECGHINPDGVAFRITGDKDNEAQFGEFPWMAALLREEGVDGKTLNVYQGGAALIHPQVVITAAHYVAAKGKKFKVRLGEWDTQHTKEIFPHQDISVKEIIVHPDFYSGALYNDIAIIILSEPAKLTDNVGLLCLPDKYVKLDYKRCYATGWGKDVFEKHGKYQVILKKIDLPVIPHDKCQQMLRKTRLGKQYELHESFICAGGEEGKDTCKGDGGSPLACPDENNRYFHAGIVSWGIGCNKKDVPGVYANVPYFRDWIDTQIGKYVQKDSQY